MTYRIGHGYDLHRLEPGRRLVLGGVEIAHDSGFVAHSDGDIVLHAITDALLGACALGNIGSLFPDTDPAYKDADSRTLLRDAYARVRAAGWQAVNIDCTIIAQAPKLEPHVAAMRDRIAAALDLEPGAVSVKPKTNEGVGPEGREEAMSAHATALLRADGAGESA